MFAILLFFYFLIFFPSSVLANSQVVIINQVRGSASCCQPGSTDFLKQQINTQLNTQLPAHFALRYDALENTAFVNQVKNAYTNYPKLVKPAILVEIIPSLAQAANVNYLATPKNFQEAQHIFTIGYSPQDRKKLLDQLLTKFHQQFGFYPELTVAWMIDTDSLNYLQDKYQIKAHLITREQMGTDTYHLYGGPPHYPFPASSSWAFMPDYENPNPILILRQTITDPSKNYGDTTNSFTSQPNDYLNGDKDFSYFKLLLDQALFNQPDTGFALLGLENSMAEKYQKEFSLQLEYLKKLKATNQLTFPNLSSLTNTWNKTPINIYQDSQAFWVTTPNYRVRLKIEHEKVFLSDLRIFNPNIKDPYNQYQAVKEGYWITPYLIDGSLNQKPTVANRSLWLKLFGPPPPSPSLTSPHPDSSTQSSLIFLPQIQKDQKPTVAKNSISYPSLNDQVTINFTEDSFTISPATPKNLNYQDFNSPQNPLVYKKTNDGFSISWNINNQTSHQLTTNCQQNQCTFNFSINPKLIDQVYKDHYPFLFPERKPRPVNSEQSVLYLHNKYAVAGRNPVRVIFIPKDKFGLPVVPEQEINLETIPQVATSNQKPNGTNNFDQIIDLSSSTPTSVNLKLKIGTQTLKSTTVFLAPNCKQNPKYCLVHPRQAFWYIKAILHDKIRLKFFGETQ